MSLSLPKRETELKPAPLLAPIPPSHSLADAAPILSLRAATPRWNHVDHIHNRIPLAIKLADLLVRDLEQQRNQVVLPGVSACTTEDQAPGAKPR